jgi:hypothetical protein
VSLSQRVLCIANKTKGYVVRNGTEITECCYATSPFCLPAINFRLDSQWRSLAYSKYASGSLNIVDCCLVTASLHIKFSRTLNIFMHKSRPV